MAKLVWDQTGQKTYETGVSNGVLFPMKNDGTYDKGVAWNGLTNVNENPSGAEANALWADNIKYLNLISTEEFKATIEAYTYPEAFKECDGSKEIIPGVYAGQQSRKKFAFVYKTLLGNDTDETDYGYKLHIIYNAIAAPSSKSYTTVNNSPEAITFSWEIDTTPVSVPGGKPTSHIVIDSSKVNADILTSIENSLFGTAEADATLLLPEDIIDLISDDEEETPGDNTQGTETQGTETQGTETQGSTETPGEGTNP